MKIIATEIPADGEVISLEEGNNRGERIRTSDLSVPNRALYQAEPRPESFCRENSQNEN